MFKLERGNLIGDEDILNCCESYRTTVKCSSVNGLLGVMKKDDFLRLENQATAWQAILMNAKVKDHNINKRIALKNRVEIII